MTVCASVVFLVMPCCPESVYSQAARSAVIVSNSLSLQYILCECFGVVRIIYYYGSPQCCWIGPSQRSEVSYDWSAVIIQYFYYYIVISGHYTLISLYSCI